MFLAEYKNISVLLHNDFVNKLSSASLYKLMSKLPFFLLGYLIGTLFQATTLEMVVFISFFGLSSFLPNATIPALAMSLYASLALLGVLGYLPFFGNLLIARHQMVVPLLVLAIFLALLPGLNKAYLNTVGSMKALSSLSINLLSVVFVAPFAFFYSRGGDRFALNLIVNSGEDNAAWLENISSGTLQSNQGSFSSQYSDGSGEPFGLLLNLVHNIFILTKDSPTQVTDSPRILMLSYGLILIFGILASLGTLLLVFSSRQASVFFVCLISIPIFLSIYFGWTSFSHLGHLPAAFSFLILLSAIALSLATGNDRAQQALSLLLIGLMIVAAGVTWVPLLPVVLVSTASYIAVILYRYSLSSFKGKTGFKLFSLALGLLILSALVVSFYQLASGIDLTYFQFLLHAQGATIDPFGWPIVLALIGLAWISNHMGTNARKIPELVLNFLLVFVSYTMLIALLSLVTQPFQLDYAAKKLALLLTSIGLVFLVYGAGIIISGLHLRPSVFYLGISTLIAGVVFLIPGPKLSYPISVMNNSVAWVSSGLEQIKKNPERPLVCLNTNAGSSAASFDIYFCNRIFGALQASKSEEVRAWAMRSLQEDWKFDTNFSFTGTADTGLTVLVNDANRVSTDNPSQEAFLNKIPDGHLIYIPMHK